MKKYKEISGNTLEQAIESECRGDLRKGYKAVCRLAFNPGFYFARQIHKALKGIGCEIDDLFRYIISTSENILDNIKAEFLKREVYQLSYAVNKNLCGDCKDCISAIIKE